MLLSSDSTGRAEILEAVLLLDDVQGVLGGKTAGSTGAVCSGCS